MVWRCAQIVPRTCILPSAARWVILWNIFPTLEKSATMIRGHFHHKMISILGIAKKTDPAQNLDPQKAWTVDLEILENHIVGLQEKARVLDNIKRQREAKKWQIIHRTCRRYISEGFYFDQPRWTPKTSHSWTLSGNFPVTSVPAYLEQHSEIAFIVYRDYELSVLEVDLSGVESGFTTQVGHTLETISLVTEEITAATTAFYKLNALASPENTKLLFAPYFAIYHGRGMLKSFLETLPHTQRLHFQVLLDYIFSQYGEKYREVDSLLNRGRITYPYIAYLFQPGDVLVEGKAENARGVLSTSGLAAPTVVAGTFNTSSKDGPKLGRREVKCWSWGFNGVFRPQNHNLCLEMDVNDNSEKIINDLTLRPLKFVSKDVANLLLRRGEMFWKCRIRHFVSYHQDKDRELHNSGDDRYMIDLKMYHELHKANKEQNYNPPAPKPNSDDLPAEALENNRPPDDKFVNLLPRTIKGYNLKTKKWLDLQVDKLAEVVWNKEAFESLVLDRKTKGLIEALIRNQLDSEKSTDLISGKGNGLILLLHGGPGTGKTLTVESVAEIAEKPLYPVTCVDIGTEPEEVETYLESVLILGKTWGCVVLLDEADVFLEQRSLEDLRRNALVSVFLRSLEYYDGILILTSNGVGTFDEAFKSRIQLALHYANLSQYQRIKVWRNFIQRLEKLGEEKTDFDDLYDHLEQLAENKMNGRQIRNAITTARQYSKWKGELLNYALLKDIIETSGRFDQYIEKLNGGYSQDQLAEDEGLRLSNAL